MNPIESAPTRLYGHDGNEGKQGGATNPKPEPRKKTRPGSGGGGRHDDDYEWE